MWIFLGKGFNTRIHNVVFVTSHVYYFFYFFFRFQTNQKVIPVQFSSGNGRINSDIRCDRTRWNCGVGVSSTMGLSELTTLHGIRMRGKKRTKSSPEGMCCSRHTQLAYGRGRATRLPKTVERISMGCKKK